jgi:hypothetical protein
LFDWVGDRIDNITDDTNAGAWLAGTREAPPTASH